MKTTVAIPVWQDQVSTTLDFARDLLIVEVDGERETARRTLPLPAVPGIGHVRILQDEHVRTLLCGAISRPLAHALRRAGIDVIPYVSGPVDTVLAAHLCGHLTAPRFLQPGCRPGARRRWRHHGGACDEARDGSDTRVPEHLQNNPPNESDTRAL